MFEDNVVAAVALIISLTAFVANWRSSLRARQGTNILTLTAQISDIYNMVDENLAEVLETRGRKKLRNVSTRERFLMLQKLHIHLDAIQMMIKIESNSALTKILGTHHSYYYRELIEWYCSVHKFYNDLLDLMGIDDSSFLHDGMKDPHRTKGHPPLFLANNKYARSYHNLEVAVNRRKLGVK